MKSIIPILALGLLAGAPLTRAQDAPPPPPAAQPPPHGGMHGMLDHLTTALNLTEDQTKQVAAIFEKQRAAMEDLRDNDALSDDDRRAKMKEMMKSSHDQIRAILTPEQQKTFDAMPPPHWGRPHPTPPPEQ